MKKRVYQGLYALLSALSHKINNRYINSYKVAVGTALLFITSGCQTPKKSNKNDDNKDTLYSDTMETKLPMDEDMLCYDIVVTDTIKADSTLPPPPKQPIIPVIVDEPVTCYVQVIECYIGEDVPIDSLEIDDQIYEVVEQMPSFPGGHKELMKYIYTNFRYPEGYGDICIHGRVIIQFIVEKDGSITDPKVLRGIERELDKQAIKLVKSFPRFIPGKQNGKEVRVKYVIPVQINIRGDEEQDTPTNQQDTITTQ